MRATQKKLIGEGIYDHHKTLESKQNKKKQQDHKKEEENQSNIIFTYINEQKASPFLSSLFSSSISYGLCLICKTLVSYVFLKPQKQPQNHQNMVFSSIPSYLDPSNWQQQVSKGFSLISSSVFHHMSINSSIRSFILTPDNNNNN